MTLCIATLSLHRHLTVTRSLIVDLAKSVQAARTAQAVKLSH
ncbi:hypothetical protein HMPREF1978_00164 [Actinomyces graevenitzii F0530]|uniref:Uncharacterized protein n=1 Tax=Actinomyces graevenitzii F0530 TaxID=1321817 RepID=U1QC88_9ACTO|nr:hypothetical protein HMPREF1978_00164 [Actinomyces graevenitzii F0530]